MGIAIFLAYQYGKFNNRKNTLTDCNAQIYIDKNGEFRAKIKID